MKWMRDRREYEAKLRARCRVSGEDYDAVVDSVVDAFESDLLDVFCDLKLHPPLKDIAEGVLLAKMKSIVDSVKNSTLPDIKALFKKELKMNMGESDVAARLLDYLEGLTAHRGLLRGHAGPRQGDQGIGGQVCGHGRRPGSEQLLVTCKWRR
ncbi:hypothetical protein PF010_g22034 [Phytophthora fragariae]|uniref:Uncharacterized protein n=1 Tax=Phytophthora fragariae TaxID=53985 RepID=A0A6A3E646_9STRA|nr:hypothetical protein PF009_g23409 [Phytophthora fragariae]KAE9002142.1 hypothetical protein PF011_g13444 [Phytophthora fragariae]KAE9081336.1 hypothetical protein PF010_g22034 [Phytophthora fragariae]